MKKIIHLFIPLSFLWGTVFCASVLANQLQSPSPPLVPFCTSPYRIGIGLAEEYINTDAKLKIIADEARLGQIGSAHSQAAKRLQAAFCGELGTAIANHYYLGLLVSGRYSGARNMSNAPIRGANFFSHEFRINHYAAVMIKPGYRLMPCFMLYGLVGPSITNWQHLTSQLDGNQRVVDTLKINKVSVGGCFGFGCEYLFKKRYALSMDYTYHFFRSTSKSQTIRYFDALTGIRTGTISKKVQPYFCTLAMRFTIFFQI